MSAFCYVLAPVMLLYVRWVLAAALADGKRRLYFLARDGYMMFRMAEYFCRQWKLPLECRYLYGSRYALRSGEYKLLGEKSLDYICLGGMRVTLRQMMRRGGLTAEEALQAGKQMGWGERMDEPLSYEQVKAMKPLLKDNSLFMDRIMAHAEKEYPNVIGYLQQEGLMEEVPYAFVDSGWTGSMQRSIRRLLRSAGCRNRTDGYYFGLYEVVKGAAPEDYHTWYFAPENGNVRKAFFCNNLFECVFSSPEGMAKGYCRKGERYEPVFAMEGNPNGERIEKGTALLLKYAEYYVHYDREKGKSRKKGCRDAARRERRAAAALLSSLMGRPSAEEARVFGGYVFDDDVTGEETRALARALTPEELREGGILRRLFRYAAGKEHPPLQSAWQEAGTVLAGRRPGWQTALYKFLLYSKKSRDSRHGRA